MIVRPLALVALAGCVSEPAQSEVRESIVGGTIDTGDPAVTALYVVEGESTYICTGALISPRVILTAAHCVNFAGAPPSTFVALFRNDIETTSGAQDSRSVVSWASDPAFDEQHPEAGHDVGLVLLDAPAPVTPIAYARTPIDTLVGAPIRLVGFGLTQIDRADAGIKRQASTTIAAITDTLLSFEGARGICIGDSGGPTLAMIDGVEQVIGVHSFGDCNQEAATVGYDTRVDRLAASIVDPFVAANDDAADPSTGGCDVGGNSAGVLVGLFFVRRRRARASSDPRVMRSLPR